MKVLLWVTLRGLTFHKKVSEITITHDRLCFILGKQTRLEKHPMIVNSMVAELNDSVTFTEKELERAGWIRV